MAKNKTPDYVLRAKANYRNKFEHINVQLPIGTKERIKELTDDSYSKFCEKLVLAELERLENQ